MSARPLTEMEPGRPVRVVAIPDDGSHRLVRLAALGLVRGAIVELVQSAPAAIVRIGATTLALETEVARRILVDSESA